VLEEYQSSQKIEYVIDFLLRDIKDKDLECFLLPRVKIWRRVRFYYKIVMILSWGADITVK